MGHHLLPPRRRRGRAGVPRRALAVIRHPELKRTSAGAPQGSAEDQDPRAKLGGIAFSIGRIDRRGKGPFVHGGPVGGGLSAFGSHTLGFRTKKPSHFRNDADKRDFVAIGTAVGVAVAFGAPIGGMLFTVEEGASFHSTGMLWRGCLATCTGVLTTHWLDQLDFDAMDFAGAKFGVHRDFGLFTDDEANYSRVFWWYFWEVPVFAAIGCMGGLLGAAFVNINVDHDVAAAVHTGQRQVPASRGGHLRLLRHRHRPVHHDGRFAVQAHPGGVPHRRRDGHGRQRRERRVARRPSKFEYGVETRRQIRDQYFAACSARRTSTRVTDSCSSFPSRIRSSCCCTSARCTSRTARTSLSNTCSRWTR